MNTQQMLFHLSIRDEERREEMTRWLSAHPPKTFAQQARLGKVAQAVIETLDFWHITMSGLEPLRTFVAASAYQRKFYDQEMHDMQGCKELLPHSILILKGRALQRWYPDSYPPRQSIDIDLLVENEEQFWLLGRWLIARHYEFSIMGIAYPGRIRSKNWYFMIPYEKRIPGAESETNTSFATIDLAQGIFPISLRHFFDMKPIAARARDAMQQSSSSKENLDAFFLYPTREDCLLTILLEISERKLEVRDAVDFYMLMGVHGENTRLMLDWSMVSQRIEEEFLIIQFLRLASYYTFISGKMLPCEIEQSYRQWKRTYSYWKWIARRPELHLIAWYYAHHSHWTHVFKEVFLNFWEAMLDSPLLESLPLHRRSIPFAQKKLDCRQTLARLLYLAPKQTAVLHWGRGKGGELLLYTPVGIFLATRSIHFSSDYLESLCKQFPND